MLRATPGVTVAWRGTKITWPCLSGWTNLSCLAPPTLVQPSRLSRATILRVLVSRAGIDRRLMRQYRRTDGRHSRHERLLQLHPGLRPLQQLRAPDWRGSTRAMAFGTEPSATW